MYMYYIVVWFGYIVHATMYYLFILDMTEYIHILHLHNSLSNFLYCTLNSSVTLSWNAPIILFISYLNSISII